MFIITTSALINIASTRSPLYVDRAPNFVRPYIIEHYANAQAVAIGQQVYRFPVTGASSGGAFSLLSTSSPSSPSSPALGVLPHHHQSYHENFFCLKGRFQLWTSDAVAVAGVDSNEIQARLLTVGDYGSVPQNTTHTFQIQDPDTEVVGVISPGGFKELFFFLADSNYTASTQTPYAPVAATSNGSGSAGPPPEVLQQLQQFDVYAELDFNPRRDLVNGSAPAGIGWHEKMDIIPAMAGRSYFVAKDHGPKFLNRDTGYQIVQPLVTPTTGEGRFTQGTITMSLHPSNGSLLMHTLASHTAFEVLEGALWISISDENATLITGDVALVPGNVTFAYWSEVAFTKVMYVSAGIEGIVLLGSAEQWGWPVFPVE
ncbi:RmlC-like cupin [Lindgomyces ingoldianus]|uniref:RmlC-like cupin n=1 Tax=Lindgomyces ingoldianus TaxID=673940 RepID=A0ACB6QR12_9PLEO|nr:RmlC-like cupin [Lindgomyces ingoldianus]KAF2468606.1 RmlC-like cupin [Lindgomyces ingoldianus]